MFVNSIPIEVVGDAYHIAANYLTRTGLIPPRPDVYQPLLDAILEDFRRGTHNKLRLANRAISQFERWNAA